jgi:hypothetical protein
MILSPAVRVIARREWSQRWRSLLVLGFLAGVFGGTVVGGTVLARRTLTAPERLFDAVRPGDAHVSVFGDLVDQIVALPEVADYWQGGVSVGRIEGIGALNYTGVVAPLRPSALMRPVVLDGRNADPARPDEVTLLERAADGLGLRVGDQLTLAMLSAHEVEQFDTGFGEPDGPTLDLTVVGIVRVPPGVFDGSPVVATPAFAEQHADLVAGNDLYVTLHGGARAFAAFSADGARLSSEAVAGSGVQDFAPVSVLNPRSGTSSLIDSSSVFFGGLLAAVVVAAIAVAAALAQAWSRHFAVGAAAQQVESALGLRARSRIAARALPALVAAAIAGAVAAGFGALASDLQPVGSLRRVEATPGRLFAPAFVVIGALAVGVTTLVLAVVSAWRAGRSSAADQAVRRPGRAWRVLPRRTGWAFAGATFAFAGSAPSAARAAGSGRRSIPVRTSLLAAVLGVAGVIGSATFGASLHRLTSSPLRYGWTADLLVDDVTDDIVAATLADARLDAVAVVRSGQLQVGQEHVAGFSVEVLRNDAPGRGQFEWVVLRGRLAATSDEVVIGPKLSARIGARIGDAFDLGGHRLRVVGYGLEPTANGEELGTSMLMTPSTLSAVSADNTFREAALRVSPSADPGAVIADYSRYEIAVRAQPTEVRNVGELGDLPQILGGLLAALALVALGHSLIVATRQRAHDLAVMRALGATPRQAGLAVVTMALTTAVVGVVAGVPLGYLVGRLLWGSVAESIAVRGDVVFPATVAIAVAAIVVAAAALALVPARRASRVQPGLELRSS